MNLPDEIQWAEARIRPYILETPLEHSLALSQHCAGEVWLKMEHLQRTGSFKLRGACNKLLALDPSQRARGVIAASTGNHGSAVAYIGQQLDCPVTVFLPEEVSPAKVANMRAYGAKLEFVGKDAIEAEHVARQSALETMKAYISPYNDVGIVAGQGTLGLELLKQLPDLDAVLVPVGGGGLISGVAGWLKAQKPDLEVIGCQPVNSPVMYQSLEAGKIVDYPSLPTLSDGTAGGIEADSLTFAWCQQWVDDFVLLTESEIKAALLFLIEHHHLMVEGAAALSVAALWKQSSRFSNKQVALILCGRNFSLSALRQLLSE